MTFNPHSYDFHTPSNASSFGELLGYIVRANIVFKGTQINHLWCELAHPSRNLFLLVYMWRPRHDPVLSWWANSRLIHLWSQLLNSVCCGQNWDLKLNEHGLLLPNQAYPENTFGHTLKDKSVCWIKVLFCMFYIFILRSNLQQQHKYLHNWWLFSHLQQIDHLGCLLFSQTGDTCKRLELPPLLEKNLKKEWALQSLFLQQEEQKGKYKKVRFSGGYLLLVHMCSYSTVQKLGIPHVLF